MTPSFRIIANSNDITEAIRTRLIRLSIADHSGEDSDSAEIVLDDRGQNVGIPEDGAELQMSIGYKESTPLSDMGLWVVDEVELSYPPATMAIRARAANLSRNTSAEGDLKNSLKSFKTRPWDDATIGYIVSKIADEAGYTAAVSS